MTIEARTNYFGIFTGKPRELAGGSELRLQSNLPSKGLGKVSEVYVECPDMLSINSGTRRQTKALIVEDLTDREVLIRDEINERNWATNRDLLFRKRTISWKPSK